MTTASGSDWVPALRILTIVPEFPVLTEPFVQARLVALAERGHEVRVLARQGDARPDGVAAFRLGTRLKRLPVPTPGPRPARAVRLLARLGVAALRDPWFVVRLVLRLHHKLGLGPSFWDELDRLLPLAGQAPDIVHFEWLNSAAQHLDLFDIIPGVKVATSRGSDLRVAPLLSPSVRRRLGPTLRALDGLHCVSDDLARIAASYGAAPEKTVVITNGADTGYFSTAAYPRRRSDDATDFRLISVGRLHWVKGYEYALQAVRALLDRGHDVVYTIAGGDDGGGEAIRLAIRDLGLQGRVELVGQGTRSRVRALLANADAFLLPSLSEGTSNALLEAMAMSLPIVATDVGGTAELFTDGTHGFLVPSRHPDALVAAVEQLVADPRRRRDMGEQAAKHVREHFDATRSLEELLAFYQRVVPPSRLVHRRAPAT